MTAHATGSVRARILEAASSLLARDPTACTDAEAAGVGRATVHRHFPARADLMRALAVEAMAQGRAALDRARLDEGPAVAALGRLVAALVPMGDRFHFLLLEPQHGVDPEYEVAEKELSAVLEEFAERGRQEGVFAPEVPPIWFVDALAALVFAAWESVHAGRIAARDAPGLVTRTLVSGLVVTGDKR